MVACSAQCLSHGLGAHTGIRQAADLRCRAGPRSAVRQLGTPPFCKGPLAEQEAEGKRGSGDGTVLYTIHLSAMLS